ncbi:hypothetical protein JCM30566_16160 [Marinitoga arctica]
MEFFVNLFLSSIVLILLLKTKMMTTAIIYMAVVFFVFKYSLKTKIIFLSFLSLLFISTLNTYSIPLNHEVGILGKIIDKTNNFYVVKSEKIFTKNSWKNTKEKLYFSYNKYSTDPFEIGNKVYITGKKLYDKFEVEYMANSSKKTIFSLRNYFKKRIYNNFPFENKDILYSVVFGGLRGKNAEIFKDTGLLHLFAVSGFHVYIIYSFLYLLYSFTLLPINFRRFITIIVLFFYLAASGFSDSATRAVFLLSIIELNKILGFNIKSKNILGIIGVTNLLYNPDVIFSVGFLMSYFAAFSILEIIEYSKNPFLIAISAFLAILPWNILFFNGFSILGLFLSFIFVPIIYSLMLASLIYTITPLPVIISNIINFYIRIINIFLQYIREFIPYITFEKNSRVIFYFFSFIILIFFHLIIHKNFQNKEEF